MPKLDGITWREEWAKKNVRRLPGIQSTADAAKEYKRRILAAAKAEKRSTASLGDDLEDYLAIMYENAISGSG